MFGGQNWNETCSSDNLFQEVLVVANDSLEDVSLVLELEGMLYIRKHLDFDVDWIMF